jgi:hypothetical protein
MAWFFLVYAFFAIFIIYNIYRIVIVHFLCLPKENEPKEKAAVHLIRLRRIALCCSK